MSDPAEGYWLDSGIRNVPVGKVVWAGRPRHVHCASVNGSPVAAIRRQLAGGWIARIEGWLWHVTPEMSAARFHLKEVPTKYFADSKAAKKAVERAFVQLAADKEKIKA